MKKVKCHLVDNWIILAFCKYMPLQGILRTWDSEEYMIKVDLFHFVFFTAVAVIMCLSQPCIYFLLSAILATLRLNFINKSQPDKCGAVSP